MKMLRLLSWPYMRKHVLRTLLTLIGIVLGAAVFTGMHTANQAVLNAFSQTIDRVAGKTDAAKLRGIALGKHGHALPPRRLNPISLT